LIAEGESADEREAPRLSRGRKVLGSERRGDDPKTDVMPKEEAPALTAHQRQINAAIVFCEGKNWNILAAVRFKRVRGAGKGISPGGRSGGGLRIGRFGLRVELILNASRPPDKKKRASRRAPI
jgi:hypothetical protein